RILSVMVLCVLLLGVFAVAAENQTNQSIKNISTNMGNITVQPLSGHVSVSVTPSILNLGTVPPDGTERSYPNAVNVIIDHNGAGDLYVRANGDLVSEDGSIISIDNLKSSTQNVTKTSFTTSNQSILRYLGTGIERVDMSFYISVPLYADPGTYSVTIIYTAT
ncbi:MAG TPA: hypothetical protein GXX32_00005, partial [Methanothermobacter sp.]|nr:hypothetical protein [Methanothermobacter sp.]